MEGSELSHQVSGVLCCVHGQRLGNHEEGTGKLGNSQLLSGTLKKNKNSMIGAFDQFKTQFPAAAWTFISPCWWHNSPGRLTERPPQRPHLERHTWTPAPSWPRRERRAMSAPSHRTWSRWPRAERWTLMCVLWCWRDKSRGQTVDKGTEISKNPSEKRMIRRCRNSCSYFLTKMSSSSQMRSWTTSSAWPSMVASNVSSPSRLVKEGQTVAGDQQTQTCFLG